MRRRWREALVLAAAVAAVAGALWVASTASGPCTDRGERAAWAQELCATDAECAVLEVRLTELGWIPPEPMFVGDRRR